MGNSSMAQKSVIVGLIVYVFISCELLHAQEHPDKRIGTKKVSGLFTGLRTGDYIHAVIQVGDTSETYFLSHAMALYMILNKDTMLNLDIEIVERYFWEGGGYYQIESILNIEAEESSFENWLEEQRSDSLQWEEMMQDYHNRLYWKNLLD